MRAKIFGLTLLVTPLIAGCTSAPRVSGNGSEYFLSRSVTVASGGEVRLGFVTALNPDCTEIPGTIVKLITAPAHGRFRQERSTGFSDFTRNNPRAACNARRTPGLQLRYAADPNYRGSDSFSYDRYTTDGKVLHHTVTVEVR